MPDRPSPSESARLLRQRIEMGATDLFLEGMTRDEALRLLALAAESGSPEPVPPRTRSAGARTPRPSGASRAPLPEASSPSSPSAAPSPVSSAAIPASGGAPALHGADLPTDYEELRSLALGCTRCSLCETRTQVVFSDGPADARVMVVGEAPGANEDETGVPFVGAAGKYLDLLLATVDLSRRDSVYIANVLKCRPPGNRNPLPAEIEACAPFLRRQIDLVRPEVLLAVGSFAGKLLTGDEKSSLGKLRGRVHAYHGVPLVVTYHPAALLRNPNWTSAFWADLQLLRDVMEADGGG